MSETMKKTVRHKIMPDHPFTAERRYKRRLGRALQAWPSADALAYDMSLEGVERDISTWIRYRAGTRTPPAWLCELLFKKSIEQTRQQIRALEQRLEAIGG